MPTYRKIGLVGFFGWGNFGDELFLEVHKQKLSKLGVARQIHDLTYKPYFTRDVNEVVSEQDAIIIGGGDLVIPWQKSELYWKMEFLEKPVFVTGVGVPTWGGKGKPHILEHYRRFMQHPNCKLVIARDIESRDWINNNLQPREPAVFYPDLVCALRLPEVEPPKDKVLGVALRHRRGGEDDFTKVRELCDRAEKLGYRVRHVVLASKKTGELDYEVTRKFARPNEEIIYSESLDEQCIAIGQCSAFVSMKFHGTVVATMYGTPSIVLSATDKSRNFLKMIEREDLKSSFQDENLPDRLPLEPARISGLVRSALRKSTDQGYDYLIEKILE